MDLSVIFDGVGSTVIGVILTAVIAAPVSYKLGQKSVKQSQRAGDGATQVQVNSSNDR